MIASNISIDRVLIRWIPVYRHFFLYFYNYLYELIVISRRYINKLKRKMEQNYLLFLDLQLKEHLGNGIRLPFNQFSFKF